ncbi:MAG: YggS family pyridoxal phosphate-dependent enzyme [Alphaproteobacteria bacterium CG_4_9_14_3_um_filter_47_13]|nr:MAG: YggS family pyridoxal phosphate-dependent enzyme [Alphaproteobacteria bacterium CG_4_9_14_3_um_filter_47_13]
MTQIHNHIKSLHTKIHRAAKTGNRDPATIHLVAVSKKQPAERIREAISAGQRLFGENKAQEAQEHWTELKQIYPDLCIHMIGALQTNKVKEAVALFDCIQTLDRPKLASAIGKEIAAQNRNIPCFIQVNTGEEAQKTGILPHELSDFHEYCRMECHIEIKGLMCLPPVNEPSSLHFSFLKKLAHENNLVDLSMGMSADFEKAIVLGATYIRVGTAFFGSRPSV